MTNIDISNKNVFVDDKAYTQAKSLSIRLDESFYRSAFYKGSIGPSNINLARDHVRYEIHYLENDLEHTEVGAVEGIDITGDDIHITTKQDLVKFWIY